MKPVEELQNLVKRIKSLNLDLTDPLVIESLKELEKLSVTPESFKIKNYEWVNGKLNVKGNVSFLKRKLSKLPFKFGVVTGSFNCEENKLTSLEGAPERVGKDFKCGDNQLTSLEGAPIEVGGFSCYGNQLTSLEGAPVKVKKDYNCNHNNLTSLKGAPKEVKGRFSCIENKLTSLEGAPRKVGGNFNCNYNQITSLKDAPKEVGGDFYCEGNQLVSLEGLPEDLKGKVFCGSNKVSSVELLDTLSDPVQGYVQAKRLGFKIPETLNKAWEEHLKGMAPAEIIVEHNKFRLEVPEKYKNLEIESEDDDLLKALEKVSK